MAKRPLLLWKSALFGLIAGTLFGGSGCSSTPVKTTAIDQIGSKASGLIFPVNLDTDDSAVATAGCEFKIKNESTGASFNFTIFKDKSFAFVAVPAGDYRIAAIICTPEVRWLVTQKWTKFHAYDDKLALFGPHELFALKNGVPSKFHTERKKVLMETIKSLIEKLAPNSRERLVSAYLGIPLSSEMTELVYKNDRIISMVDKKTRFTHWKPAFQPCYDAEHETNELFAGLLAISAVYENSVATQVEVSSLPNSYTERFKKCVIAAAKNYKPSTTEKVLANYYF
jgi:hypothetical protein